ncbi:Endosomal protein P24B [Schizosaccharomyces pombe]|uniref:Endosomal protein P24B n=1 Tax=Schizosaccharomyces pombe (strain 972 / ATCC 24843) TaxID=284812 RepID=EMP24_SCHPO|nr:putative COPII-coated vesicle-associated protein Emp24 [Schizosaccharomyces pombe]Q9P7I9.1 RecName: Full=Endosomal protein P24B; Flags: Precursor [Schizosaccharomyces pombe 972h-]CAB76226.1 COPII-coated vesicle component Emp24 (predicted) [Schizosaccharomyces pombe]|eukprot:NP_588020.1 putative COPII-coated vesicle-associated protein Emp24 [Schizosaccharomyces pombe]
MAFFNVFKAVLCAYFISVVFGHGITLKPHQRECFYENLRNNDQMSVTYQTNVGGDQLVSMSIYNPAGQIMHQEVPNSMAQYSFTVKNPGKYMYCFYNDALDGESKEVLFNVHGVIYISDEDLDANNPLLGKVRQLHDTISKVKHEQEYFVARERIHRNTAESTNDRVKWWSILQTVILVSVCVFQIFYLKRLFEVKRVV